LPGHAPAHRTSAAYLISVPDQPIPVDWDAAPSADVLDERDFLEVYEVDCDDLRATNELHAAEPSLRDQSAPELQPSTYIEVRRAPVIPVRPPVIVRPQWVPERIDPASARYIVTSGANPGEVVLRALEPGEPPPFGVPVAKLAPSCDLDRRCIATMLNR